MLVPLGFFAMIAAIVLVPQYLRARERERLHDTLRLAYEKGQPVPPELIEALTPGRPVPDAVLAPRPPASRDLRRGLIWLAVGVGLIAIGGVGYAANYTTGGSVEFLCFFLSVAAIPIFVGIAFLVLYVLGRKHSA